MIRTGTATSLQESIYYAAKDGMAITLYAILENKTAEEVGELLETPYSEDGQKTTPIIVAARHGNDKMVKMLLTKFSANIEQTGTVKFDGYMIEGATALWCAAAEGHMNVVKVLVEHGADVNHPTSTNSTPLRAACFDGRLDIVKYLVQNKADLLIANKYNNTCLMIASYKGHLGVVHFLLVAGALPDERAHCGATALHFAAECGHLDIVKSLLVHNARMLPNDFHVDPLLSAAESCQAEVVEHLISSPRTTRRRCVDAYELLGASFANDKDHYDIEKAFTYLMRGMKERYADPRAVLRKDPAAVRVPAYARRVECATVNDLEAIRDDHAALHMEALSIRERILGAGNPEVPHPIIFRGAVFADGARFDRCVALWLHALRLRQNASRSVTKDLLRFAQVFSQMRHVGVPVEFSHLHEVLQHASVELRLDRVRATEADDGVERTAATEQANANLLTILYLVIVYAGGARGYADAQRATMCRLVYAIVRTDPRRRDGASLLHLAVDPRTPVDDFHTNDVCAFPNAPLAKLLVACGADVNAVDATRNTPLHVIVGYRRPAATELQADFNVLHSIIELLVDSGAHLDPCNDDGQTPMQASVTGVAEVIIRTQIQLSLKCMAARAANQHGIAYEGHVPKNLEGFIAMHGCPADRGRHSDKVERSLRADSKTMPE
ncbi:PREDICTED: protein fem-1 homolog B-like [Priapulus caudatus]|uniref:Protein fem-1 homolog B n=1 Tax=Priapulus caudatus TaxID=37621 RepID=A0ABM1EIR7_PRICU|nr:PREDICTED: protein fem-1 homolog B-like [Priapulus caudatus]